MKAYRNKIFTLTLIILIIFGQSLLTAAETRINMNFKGVDIRDVFRTIAELADVNLVTDGSVVGNITVHLKELSFSDALDLITQTHDLAYKWYENTVVIATPERIDQIYEDIVVKTVDVNYADLREIENILNGVYPILSIVPDQRNHKLIFRGKAEDIRNAEKLLAKLEIESDYEGFFKFLNNIKVNYIDVIYLKELVNEMYPEINIIADSQNNQLVFNGSKEQFSQLKALVSIIDIEQFQIEDCCITESIDIEHADIANVIIELEEISNTLSVEALYDSKKLIIKGVQRDVERALFLASSIDKQEEKLTKVIKIDYASLEELEDIITNLYPDINFLTSSQNKEVILNGKKDLVEDVLLLIAEIDIPRKQVIIEARVEEIFSTDLRELGVNSDQLSKIEFMDQNDDGFIDHIGLTFANFITLLESKGVSNTLANPRLMTISGEEASLLIGDRIPVTVESVEDGSVIRSIEYIEAGINLIFTPWVTSDNKINLKVNPQVSSIGNSIGTALPPINTREAETTIRLNDGETFGIGGLIQDDIIDSISKIPLLGDIPIFGKLFKSRNEQNIKTELIIFITPYIVDNQMEMIAEKKENDLECEKNLVFIDPFY